MNEVRRKDIRLRIGDWLVIIDLEHGSVTEHHFGVKDGVVENSPTKRIIAAFLVVKDNHRRGVDTQVNLGR